MSESIADALSRAKLSEKTVPVCLDASAIEAYREAEAASAAAFAADDSLSKTRAPVPDELAEAVEAATIRLTLRARSRPEWRALLKEHPPRKDNPVDRQLGCNEDTFYEALVRTSIVSHEISDSQWERLNAALNEGEWTRLVGAAQGLNLKVSQLPF